MTLSLCAPPCSERSALRRVGELSGGKRVWLNMYRCAFVLGLAIAGILLSSPAFAAVDAGVAADQLHKMASGSFSVAIDRSNGSIARISHPADTANMNWVTSAFDAAWQQRSEQWGLGFANVGPAVLHRGRWEIPKSLELNESDARAIYQVGELQVQVVRTLQDDVFKERYIFTNTGTAALSLKHWSPGTFAVALPFNDHYTTAEDCLEHRAHTHLWCGGTTSWVSALRMGGRAPHLGMVVTEGALKDYSVTGRDLATSSNTRGVFLVHPDLDTLEPGASYVVGWTLFWHNGWEDFFSQCESRSKQFVRVQASRYTAAVGEAIEITVSSRTELGEARLMVGPHPVPLKGEGTTRRATLHGTAPGELKCELTIGGEIKTTFALNIVPLVEDVIAARVRFIAERHQVTTVGDPLEGAFLVMDNERDVLVHEDWGHDRNEARERIGMGVLLARWLRSQPKRDEKVMASLQRYYKFVCERLQRDDGTVLNGVNSDEPRLYNWPWVMQLHLEMAALTGERVPLRRFVQTVEKFYASGGEELYAIGLPVLQGLEALSDAKWKNDYDHLRAYFSRHGKRIAARGLVYPPHEVHFEQSIVAPAAILLLELYRATGEAEWLEAARPHLRCLELFGGRQPDHRLHEIAIRHWDGYWFGKSRMWGDTFPHYWSTLTAVAFHHYGTATDDPTYLARAQAIVRNNLSLFTSGGRASCAYIYPLTVNGQPARGLDAYANDQDWALVNGLMIGVR